MAVTRPGSTHGLIGKAFRKEERKAAWKPSPPTIKERGEVASYCTESPCESAACRGVHALSCILDLVCGEIYPPNLSILISGGKETNRDSLSKGD